jgi:hypothetical protein
VAAWLATQPLDGPMGAYRKQAADAVLTNTQWLLVTDAYRQARGNAAAAAQGLGPDHSGDGGPLPALPWSWYAQPISNAAKCFDWPQGCGEYARRPGGGPAVLRHRDGCPSEHAAQ